jgi:uncharacterized repeat protein (TIGR04002 family)
MVMAAMFATLVFVAIYFIHIPNGQGGVIHFGDSIIFLAAVLLPFPYAMPAAALGAGMFNLVRLPIWLPFTIVIKPLMTLCFENKGDRILTKRNIIAPFAAATINTILYFFANWLLFDQYTAIGAFVPLLIQGVGSVIAYFALAGALDAIRIKRRMKF